MSLTRLQLLARERMTEDELLQAITEAATYLGWRWHHIRRSDQALQMGHSGFPDLVMVKGDRLLFLELKTEAGTLTVDQYAWVAALRSSSVRAAVIRPSDLDALLEDLQR